MGRVGYGLVALGVMLSLAGAASAEVEEGERIDCGLCRAAAAPTYGTHAAGTLGRGLTNGLLCWTELFSQPTHAVQEQRSVFDGLNKGVGLTIQKLLLGASEILTFWSPPGHLVMTHSCVLDDMRSKKPQ